MFRFKFRFIHTFILTAFMFTSLHPQAVLAGEVVMPIMPKPGTMVHLSPAFNPAHVQGISIYPNNALQFDFLINPGDGNLDKEQKQFEYNKLVKYFLASLTIPDEKQWVNLSPYEKDHIIDQGFGQTIMGKDLLEQDYLLKQITSSLLYPESGIGKKFWDTVHQKALATFGTTNIPVDTFNKVWITPARAVIYEKGNTAFILESKLKVLLEEDYLAKQKNVGQPKAPEGTNGSLTKNARDVIREIIIPELEKEINEGKNFAQLRQIYSAMVLASWYKKALKDSLLTKVYADKTKVAGVLQNPVNNQEVYNAYLQAFKKGAYNFIKVEVDPKTQQAIPKKYFAGGFAPNDVALIARTPEEVRQLGVTNSISNSFDKATVNLAPSSERQSSLDDKAMLVGSEIEKVKFEKGEPLVVNVEERGVSRVMIGVFATPIDPRVQSKLGIITAEDRKLEIFKYIPPNMVVWRLNKWQDLKEVFENYYPYKDGFVRFLSRFGITSDAGLKEKAARKQITYQEQKNGEKAEDFIAYGYDGSIYRGEMVFIALQQHPELRLFVLGGKALLGPVGDDLKPQKEAAPFSWIDINTNISEEKKTTNNQLDVLVWDFYEIHGLKDPKKMKARIDNLHPRDRVLYWMYAEQAFNKILEGSSRHFGRALTSEQALDKRYQHSKRSWVSTYLVSDESFSDPFIGMLQLKQVMEFFRIVGFAPDPNLGMKLDDKAMASRQVSQTPKEDISRAKAKLSGREAIRKAWFDEREALVVSYDDPQVGSKITRYGFYAITPIDKELTFRPSYVTSEKEYVHFAQVPKSMSVWRVNQLEHAIEIFKVFKDFNNGFERFTRHFGREVRDAISLEDLKNAVRLDWDLEDVFVIGYDGEKHQIKDLDKLMKEQPNLRLFIIGRVAYLGPIGSNVDGSMTSDQVSIVSSRDDFDKLVAVRVPQLKKGQWLVIDYTNEHVSQAELDAMRRQLQTQHPQLEIEIVQIPTTSKTRDEGSFPRFILRNQGNAKTDDMMMKADLDPSPKATPHGGIDLNAANLDLLIKRDGNGVPLPIAQQDMSMLGQIQGFVPNIIEIVPVTNMPLLTQLKNELDSPTSSV